jgi:hypothetical protein
MSRNTRRRFLKQTAALGIGLGVNAASSGRAVAANEKISVACIGVHWSQSP